MHLMDSDRGRQGRLRPGAPGENLALSASKTTPTPGSRPHPSNLRLPSHLLPPTLTLLPPPYVYR